MSTALSETCVIGGVETGFTTVIPADMVAEGRTFLDDHLANTYQACGEEVLSICVLKGAQPLTDDLMNGRFGNEVNPLRGAVRLSSRRSGVGGPGELQELQPLEHDVAGRSVVVIEDLTDSLLTLSIYTRRLLAQGAAAVAVVSLIDKPDAHEYKLPEGVTRTHAFNVHSGLWVVGYGMDIDGRFRDGNIICAPDIQLAQVPDDQWYQPTWR